MKKTQLSKLMSVVLALAMIVTSLVISVSPAKAEDVPRNDQTVQIDDVKAGFYKGKPALVIGKDEFSPTGSDILFTVQTYQGTSWQEFGSVTKARSSAAIVITSDDIPGLTTEVYYRLRAKTSTYFYYSDVLIIKSDAGEIEVGPSAEELDNCDHSKNTNPKQRLGVVDYNSKGHVVAYSFKCSFCGKGVNQEVLEAHKLPATWKPGIEGTHYRYCSDCNYRETQKCKYKVKKASMLKDSYDLGKATKGHDAVYVCSVCKETKTEYGEKHNGKKKCTVCGWKKVKPSNLKGVKVSIKSKKSQSKTFTSKGYFDYLGRWVPGKTTKSSFKILKVKINFKKPKNGYKYKIEKRPGSGTTMNDFWITSKTNGSYTMWFTGGTKKATVKITPYSKYGVKGKTIVKTIKF
ncbi:MAG: hypothetical protein K6G65_02175 [Lachnospiraceae bacterium]|nr:hypothetical protein [Lachnospiraceae bacterium]